MLRLPVKKEKLSAALGAWLVLSFLVLLLQKAQLLSWSRERFLLFINYDLIFLSGLAAIFAGAAVWRTGRAGADRLFWRSLCLGVVILFLWEIILFVEEIFFPVDELDLGIVKVFGLAGRAVLMLSCLILLLGAKPEIKSPGWLAVLLRAGIVALLVLAVWFIVQPLLREYGSLAAFPGVFAMILANVLCLAFIAETLAGGKAGGPVSSPARFFPLLGLALYLFADVMYYFYFAVHDDGFNLLEVGYFAGYLAVAFGSLYQPPAPEAAGP